MTKQGMQKFIEGSLRGMDGMKLTYAEKAQYIVTKMDTLFHSEDRVKWQDEPTKEPAKENETI